MVGVAEIDGVIETSPAHALERSGGYRSGRKTQWATAGTVKSGHPYAELDGLTNGCSRGLMSAADERRHGATG
jgi:hypothetical protein